MPFGLPPKRSDDKHHKDAYGNSFLGPLSIEETREMLDKVNKREKWVDARPDVDPDGGLS